MSGSTTPRAPKAGRRGRLRAVLTALFLFVSLGIVTLLDTDRFFYYPDDEVHGTPAEYGVDVEDVEFAAPGGPRLHGWWIDAEGASKGTVVYCHGNAANITLHARYVAWLPKRGYSVLAFDYRGYGRSEGAPSREGTVDDAVAAIDFALARDPGRTLVFGHSLGGAVGVVAASRRSEVRAVVAESTFPSYRAVARASVPLFGFMAGWFVPEGLDPVTVVGELAPRPLLVIHGDADEIVPIELGRGLYDRASEPKEFWSIAGADHFTPWVHLGEEFEVRICAFFAAALEQ